MSGLRIVRSATLSLLILLGAYFAYAHTVGVITDFPQLDESELPPDPDGPFGDDDWIPVVTTELRESERAAIRGFGWYCDEVDAPLVLESHTDDDSNIADGRVVGLFIYAENYEVLKENPKQIRLHPFSLVHISAGETSRQDQIDTVRGQEAVLEFDRPIDLTQLSGVKPRRGWVQGKVELRTNCKNEDPGDDIILVTEKLYYVQADHLVWTDKQVSLKTVDEDVMITGVEMELELNEPDTGKDLGPQNAEAKQVTLFRDVRFDLLLEDDSNFLGAPIDFQSPEEAVGPKSPVPFAIECSGPFVYDLRKDLASFKESVRMLRKNPPREPGGPESIDELTCDELTLQFVRKNDSAPGNPEEEDPQQERQKAQLTQKGKLELLHATAIGEQVMLFSDSERLLAVGDYLFHDAITRKVILVGKKELMKAVKDETVIHAHSLVIEPGEDKTIRNLVAEGPDGWMGFRDEKSLRDDQYKMQVRWQGQLTLEKKPGSEMQVVTITKDVELDDERGAFRCGELKVWFVPIEEPGKEKRRLEPIRIEASQKVTTQSEELAVVTEHLTVDFVHKRQPSPNDEDAELDDPADLRVESPESRVESLPSRVQSPKSRVQSPEPKAKSQKPKAFKESLKVLRANRVAVIVEQEGTKTTPVQAWAEGNVFFEQMPARPEEEPVQVRGQTLGFERRPRGDVIKVTGGPKELASIKTSDFFLAGRKILLDRIENHVRVEGAGYLVLQSENGFNGEDLGGAQTLRTDWNRGMDFDGRQGFFEGQVLARLDSSDLQCQRMEVLFDRKIEFDRTGEQRRNDRQLRIQEVFCEGEVVASSTRQEKEIIDRLFTVHCQTLHFDDLGHQVHAKGPGIVKIVELSEPELDQNGRRITPRFPFQLTLVKFHERMDGDRIDQSVKFDGRIHILHTPVLKLLDQPDENDLPPDGLTVDAADFAEMAQKQGRDGREFRDFRAKGNVRVHAREYWGQSDRLSYDGQKDLLLLESEGSHKAHFYRQPHIGQPPVEFSAKSIKYWRRIGKISTTGSDGFNQ